jgi:hypothetical protein
MMVPPFCRRVGDAHCLLFEQLACQTAFFAQKLVFLAFFTYVKQKQGGHEARPNQEDTAETP